MAAIATLEPITDAGAEHLAEVLDLDSSRHDDPVVPQRTIKQRRDALLRANEIRIRRAQLKRDLKARRESIHNLLLSDAIPDWLDTAKVYDLLRACPKYGRVKVNKAFQQARVSPSKTLGGMTQRQRVELASLIRR